jgi:hypothetical protein
MPVGPIGSSGGSGGGNVGTEVTQILNNLYGEDGDLLTAYHGSSASVGIAGSSPGDVLTRGGSFGLFEWSPPAAGGSGMANPMTAQGDLIVEGEAGPEPLAIGDDGQVLTLDPATHMPAWADAPSGGSGPAWVPYTPVLYGVTDTDRTHDVAAAMGAGTAIGYYRFTDLGDGHGLVDIRARWEFGEGFTEGYLSRVIHLPPALEAAGCGLIEMAPMVGRFAWTIAPLPNSLDDSHSGYVACDASETTYYGLTLWLKPFDGASLYTPSVVGTRYMLAIDGMLVTIGA